MCVSARDTELEHVDLSWGGSGEGGGAGAGGVSAALGPAKRERPEGRESGVTSGGGERRTIRKKKKDGKDEGSRFFSPLDVINSGAKTLTRASDAGTQRH